LFATQEPSTAGSETQVVGAEKPISYLSPALSVLKHLSCCAHDVFSRRFCPIVIVPRLASGMPAKLKNLFAINGHGTFYADNVQQRALAGTNFLS
jgi:hypothetical protein